MILHFHVCFCLVVVSKETGGIKPGVQVRGEIRGLGATERKPPCTVEHSGPGEKTQVGTAPINSEQPVLPEQSMELPSRPEGAEASTCQQGTSSVSVEVTHFPYFLWEMHGE